MNELLIGIVRWLMVHSEIFTIYKRGGELLIQRKLGKRKTIRESLRRTTTFSKWNSSLQRTKRSRPCSPSCKKFKRSSWSYETAIMSFKKNIFKGVGTVIRTRHQLIDLVCEVESCNVQVNITHLETHCNARAIAYYSIFNRQGSIWNVLLRYCAHYIYDV